MPSLLLHRMALSERVGGLEDYPMGEIVHFDFARRVKISREEYLRGADRCERAAMTQDRDTARVLRGLARQYRQQGGGA